MTIKKQGLELEQLVVRRIAKDLEMLPSEGARSRVLDFVNAHFPKELPAAGGDFPQARLPGT